MKKSKTELIRAQTMIESDRLNTNDDFIELVEGDVCKLFKDYFDFNDAPQMLIGKVGNKLKVEVVVLVDRIKNFSKIPNK